MKPVFDTKDTAVDTAAVSVNDAGLEALLDSLGVSESSKKKVASHDLSALTASQKEAVCKWFADQCGLYHSEVCVISTNGISKPYVRAAGLMRLARERVLSIVHTSPRIEGKLCIVECTVIMKDNTVFHDIGAREIVDAKSIMACSTASTVRALRLAVGIPLPGEGELDGKQ